MAVTLSLIKHPPDVVLSQLSLTLGAEGAVLGRGADAAWVLADPRRFLSARHCEISLVNGRYHLTDLSTNGTFLNGSKKPLGRGTQAVLQDGDRICLGDYLLAVSILSSEAVLPDAIAFGESATKITGACTNKPVATPAVEARLTEPETADIPAGQRHSCLKQNVEQPCSDRASQIDKAKSSRGHGASHPVKTRDDSIISLQNNSANAQLQCDLLIQALGLDKMQLTPQSQAELPQIVGEMLRESLVGLMQALHARASIKNEFRLCITTIQPVENNPIKFSANVDDAMQSLFVRRSPAFKAPVAAIKDGFDAIADHQIATIAGLRAAFKALLGSFDPAALEQSFQQDSKPPLVRGLGKGKYWKAYEGYYRKLSNDLDGAFHDLFGDEFVVAYEDQLGKLAKAREAANKCE